MTRDIYDSLVTVGTYCIYVLLVLPQQSAVLLLYIYAFLCTCIVEFERQGLRV